MPAIDILSFSRYNRGGGIIIILFSVLEAWEQIMSDRKDEIIRLQNDIVQNLLKKQFQSLTEDFWGLRSSIDNPADPGKEDPSSPEAGTGKAAPAAAGKSTAESSQAQAESGQAQAEKEETIDQLREELHSYIGLDVIKEQTDSLINWIRITRLRGEQGLPVPDLSLHMVFTGNPGTGKTMIARLMARIFKALGLLSKGHLVEVDRSGLVAGYVGQTAIKTQEVLDKALGGVLFIDEAYALTQKGGTDYGQEAVDTLLKGMEDHREDLVVIVAGYTRLMEEFIHSNPGLESRFNRFLHFPDYSVKELTDIFRMRCEKSGYRLKKGADRTLIRILEEKSQDVQGFGNARGARNLFESAIARQADRLAGEENPSREDLMTLTKEDLLSAVGEMPAKKKKKTPAENHSGG